MRLYIRTLDGNIPHPNAAKPVFETPNQSWVTIHISGSILACLFVEPVPNATDFLVVWDWKTGNMLGVGASLAQSPRVSNRLGKAYYWAKTKIIRFNIPFIIGSRKLGSKYARYL